MNYNHFLCIAMIACLASMSCGPSYQRPGADFSLADPPAGTPTATAVFDGSGGALYQAPFEGSRVLAKLGAYERLTILKTVLKTKTPDGVDWFLAKTGKGATGYVSEKEVDDFSRAKSVDLMPHYVVFSDTVASSGPKDGQKTYQKGAAVEAKFGLNHLTWLDDDGIVPTADLVVLDQFEVGKDCEAALVGAGQGNAYKNCFDESSEVSLSAGESATYVGSPDFGPPEGTMGDLVVDHPVFLMLEDGSVVCMAASDPLFAPVRHEKRTFGFKLGETPDSFHFEIWKNDMSRSLDQLSPKRGTVQEFFEGKVPNGDSTWLVDVVDRSFGLGPSEGGSAEGGNDSKDDPGAYTGSVTVEEVWGHGEGGAYSGFQRTLNLSVSNDRFDIELNQDPAFDESSDLADKVAGHYEYHTVGSMDGAQEQFSYSIALWKGEYFEVKDGSWDSGPGGKSIEDVSDEISGALAAIEPELSQGAFSEGLFNAPK